jgi:hypothetical protein
LAGHGRNAIEVRVAVKDREIASLGGRGEEQIWDLALALVLAREPTRIRRA